MIPSKLYYKALKVESLLHSCKRERRFIFVAGNGGSCCESDHLVSELIGINYPAISLTSNQAVLTALSNDLGYEEAVAHQLATLGKEGDIFIALTTSGTSKNLLRALRVAEANKIYRIVLTGQGKYKNGGPAASLADCDIIVESNDVQVIQETHLEIIHQWYKNLKNRKEIS